MQGMSAGVGTVVGRAIIRDCFEGAAATRLLALVSMIFSLSPALAPVFGGWVVTLFTWREVPAAILTLVSPEAAEWFPDIPGYRIFRIPLSPR
jgi:MFS transporter, DHA1 family, multidrug resistance protein